MVVRFTLPKDELSAWCRWAWRDAAKPAVRRARVKGIDLAGRCRRCAMRPLMTIAGAALAIVTTTQALTPASSDPPPMQQIDIKAFVQMAQRDVHARDYAWLGADQRAGFESLEQRIAPPAGFERIVLPPDTFAHWLRHLPAAPVDAAVCDARQRERLPAGTPGVASVVELQPHTAALGAAGMMVRLRAECAWAKQRTNRLAFHFTSGQRFSWPAWANGIRALQGASGTRFERSGIADDSRESFCAWIETQLHFTSLSSLLDDTRRVEDGTIAPGDVFVRTGRDGHCVIVLDVAVANDGRVAVMLGSGDSPASTFHVLSTTNDSAWFMLGAEPIESALHGTFEMRQLRRWAM